MEFKCECKLPSILYDAFTESENGYILVGVDGEYAIAEPVPVDVDEFCKWFDEWDGWDEDDIYKIYEKEEKVDYSTPLFENDDYRFKRVYYSALNDRYLPVYVEKTLSDEDAERLQNALRRDALHDDGNDDLCEIYRDLEYYNDVDEIYGGLIYVSEIEKRH